MNQISEIIEKWDIPKVIEIASVNAKSFKLFCDDEKRYFLKAKESDEQIEFEEGLLGYLKDNGMPVSVPLTTILGKCYAKHNGKYYALYKFIDGHHLRCSTFDEYKGAVAIYGTILGKLHQILKTYNKKHECIKKMDLSSRIFEWSLPAIESYDMYPEIKGLVSELKKGMLKIFKSLPKQYIHRDFHEDNMMFDGNKFIGLIDFDICMIGHKIYDICYIMTSILMNGIYVEAFKKNWLTLLSIFIESYLKINELGDTERNGLWYVFIASQLTFIAYFIKHPNEKLLKENVEGLLFIYENRASIQAIINSMPRE